MSHEIIEALEFVKQLMADGSPQDEAVAEAIEIYELPQGLAKILDSYLNPWA